MEGDHLYYRLLEWTSASLDPLSKCNVSVYQFDYIISIHCKRMV